MEKSKILLVDDEPSIRTVLKAVLESQGFSVSTAEDGFVALRSIRASLPDLLISDLRMPNMNGFELLAVVREKFPTIPVIAISGEFVGEQVRGVLADVFLQKGSYSPQELLTTVEGLLSETQERAKREQVGSTVWAPTGDAPLMVTCSECYKSFPLDPCEDQTRNQNEVQCIFCGTTLRYKLVAITRAV
jgi:DNA-binding response OmpR family regulator